jgi:plastocyanin
MGTSCQISLHFRCAVCSLTLAASSAGAAATLTVSVIDGDGRPVKEVAVYAVPRERPPVTAGTEGAAAATAVMDQVQNTFVPHLLVVQAGTSVVFPNSDTVSHHVYSFSPAKTFELGLYRGNAHPPLLFENTGVVVLGCNIHDGMLGYILVVDTPHFAVTAADGAATLAGLPAGEYTTGLWTPRARPGDLPPDATVALNGEDAKPVVFRIDGKLRPEHDHSSTSLSWERY